MKLRNICIVCREKRATIENLVHKEITLGGRQGARVTGWKLASMEVSELSKYPVFHHVAEELMESVPTIYRIKDSFDIPMDRWKIIETAKSNLLKTMDTIDGLCETVGVTTENKIGLDIKLPSFSDFSDFSKFVSELEYIFTKCPYFENEKEKLQFVNVDVGTTWLTFFVVGASATVGSIILNNVVSFIDKCLIVRSHYLTIEKQKNDLEVEKKNQQEKQVILVYLEDLYKKQVEIAINELNSLTGHKEADKDERDRIELAMEKMGALIDKGLQIYATIDSPSELKALFEPLEMKYLEIGKKVELLEEKED